MAPRPASQRRACRAYPGWAVAGLVLALVAFAPDAGASQPFDLGERQRWDGCGELYDLVRREVGRDRVVVDARLDWSELRSIDALLIVHPLRAIDGDELSAFLRAGGRAAIIDDFGKGDEILARFHIERTGPPLRPYASLRHNPELAIAEPVAEAPPPRPAGGGAGATGPVAPGGWGVHPIAADVPRLVTNHPTAFRHPNLTPVLRIRAIGEPDAALAVAGQVDKGRLVAMGDPSAFINQMLRYPGNRAFATGLARYLAGDEAPERRAGKLHLLVGRFGETGTFGGRGAGVAQTVESALRAVGAVLREIATDGLPPFLALLLGAAVVVGVGGWTATFASRGFPRRPPRFARAQPLVAQGGVAGRAAVLAAPTSDRALAMLELKRALEEALAEKVGYGVSEPVARIVLHGIKARGALSEASYRRLKAILVELGEAETCVLAGRPSDVRSRDVERVWNEAQAILAEVDERLPARPSIA